VSRRFRHRVARKRAGKLWTPWEQESGVQNCQLLRRRPRNSSRPASQIGVVDSFEQGNRTPQFHAPWFVHAQYSDCRAPNVGQPRHLARVGQCEMLFPNVATRIEESRDRMRVGVDTREIGAFAKIAPPAGERQILFVVSSPVASGDDVLNLKKLREVTLRDVTILTPASGSVAHKISDIVVHYASPLRVRSVAVAVRLSLNAKQREYVHDLHVSGVLLAFFFRESPFIRLLAKFVKPALKFGARR